MKPIAASARKLLGERRQVIKGQPLARAQHDMFTLDGGAHLDLRIRPRASSLWIRTHYSEMGPAPAALAFADGACR
jgi:hypothetical protein